jgi:glycosyltransferase involved in cell wall biosynthesis
MPSVIIPAHNEEAMIERVIEAVLADGIKDLECVVVPNACSDRTAEIARRFEPAVRVLETDTPGKCNALNLGEKHLSRFPRVFLDGDIVLHKGALKALIAASSPERPIISPMPMFILNGATLAIKLFFRAQRFNKYFGGEAPNGSGTFVLSEAARSRWETFPEIIADDGFVQGHFRPEERSVVKEAIADVGEPRDISSLLKVRARVRRGHAELAERYPELMRNHVARGGSMIRSLLPRPLEWPGMLVYGYVRIAERLIARRQLKSNVGLEWGRDESSRSNDHS